MSARECIICGYEQGEFSSDYVFKADDGLWKCVSCLNEELAALKEKLAVAERFLLRTTDPVKLSPNPFDSFPGCTLQREIQSFLTGAPGEYVAVDRKWMEGMAQGKCYCSSPLHATCNHCRAKAALRGKDGK